MIMKTLQNNFTTPEQSKRLLEVGVPADSADFYWKHEHKRGVLPRVGNILTSFTEEQKKIIIPIMLMITLSPVGRLVG